MVLESGRQTPHELFWRLLASIISIGLVDEHTEDAEAFVHDVAAADVVEAEELQAHCKPDYYCSAG